MVSVTTVLVDSNVVSSRTRGVSDSKLIVSGRARHGGSRWRPGIMLLNDTAGHNAPTARGFCFNNRLSFYGQYGRWLLDHDFFNNFFGDDFFDNRFFDFRRFNGFNFVSAAIASRPAQLHSCAQAPSMSASAAGARYFMRSPFIFLISSLASAPRADRYSGFTMKQGLCASLVRGEFCRLLGFNSRVGCTPRLLNPCEFNR